MYNYIDIWMFLFLMWKSDHSDIYDKGQKKWNANSLRLFHIYKYSFSPMQLSILQRNKDRLPVGRLNLELRLISLQTKKDNFCP